jgi:phosphatidylinositol 4-kinase
MSGIQQHSGLSLAVESITSFADYNSFSSPLSTTTLEKLPNFIKNNCSEFIASMSLRTHFAGEVSGMLSSLKSNDKENELKLATKLINDLKESCIKQDLKSHQESVYKITALLIATPVCDRQLVHALCWAPVDLFSEDTIASVISCWKWLLAARSDLELKVRLVFNKSIARKSLSLIYKFLKFCQKFIEEMASAWSATIDRKLGLFAEDPPQTDPLTSHVNSVLKPNPPYIGGHGLWVKVIIFVI